MQLRIAKITDVDTVLSILRSSRNTYLPYAPSPHSIEGQRRWIASTLIPSGGVLIARINQNDVGVLATSVDNAYGWIDQLYVAPGHTDKGIGTHLLRHALTVLPRPVRLWTFQKNSGARRFYERHGFKALKYTDGQNNEERCPDVLYEYV